MRLLISDMAGRASIELKGAELGFDLARRPGAGHPDHRPGQGRWSRSGYTFEAADASFELLLVEEVEGARPSYFEVESWRVITDSRPGEEAVSEATIKLLAGGARIITTGEGNGPVNALDQSLREAIGQAYPEVAKFELIDYKVRILDQGHGTDAVTRVLIETTDGDSSLGHGRRRPQRHRGVVGRARRRGHLRPAPPRRAARLTTGIVRDAFAVREPGQRQVRHGLSGRDDVHGDGVAGVVGEAAAAPGRPGRLYGAAPVARPGHQHVVAGARVPVEAERAPGVRARRRAQLRVAPRAAAVGAHLDPGRPGPRPDHARPVSRHRARAQRPAHGS